LILIKSSTGQVWPINLAISSDSSLRLSTPAVGGVWTARVRPDATVAPGSDYVFDAPAASLAVTWWGFFNWGSTLWLLNLANWKN
jgi:hypothetical protein